MRMTLNLREPSEAEYTCENVRNFAGISALRSCSIPRAADVTKRVSASLSIVTVIAARGRWNKFT